MELIFNPLPPKAKAVFPKSVNTDSLPVYKLYHLKATNQLITKIISVAMKDVVILREIHLTHKNEKLQKCANRLMS